MFYFAGAFSSRLDAAVIRETPYALAHLKYINIAPLQATSNLLGYATFVYYRGDPVWNGKYFEWLGL